MLTLPDVIVPILAPFATLFTNPTWRKAQLLMVGAILATGQRTVAATLRVMGRSNQDDYARYHEVLNRAVWSPREAARILLLLLLQYLDCGDGPLVFGIDETLERRRGAKISARGIYRDAVRSSRHQLVKASGSALDLPDVVGTRCPGPEGAIGRCRCSPCWRHRLATISSRDAGTRRSPTGPGRWSCYCAAGCPIVPWCWWGTTATPYWICSTAASPCASRSPSSPVYVWTPLSTRQRRPVSRVKMAGRG